jgi:hypothetical protein
MNKDKYGDFLIPQKDWDGRLVSYKDSGYDEDGKPVLFGGYDYCGGVRTHDDYWDCECDQDYIHLKSKSYRCEKCEYTADCGPDSRVNEVADYFGWLKEVAA